MTIWHTLGIEATHDARIIKRAYAARLKQIDPQQDLAVFQALREAYEQALAAPQEAPPSAFPALLPLDQLDADRAPTPPRQSTARTAFSALPALPELALQSPLARPLALDLEPESEAALAAQRSQRWLPGPRPQSYATARPQLRPGPQPPAPEAAAEQICQALARLPAAEQAAALVRFYAQPGWGNGAFREALEGALADALERDFAHLGELVPAVSKALQWGQWGEQSPHRAAIRRLLDRSRARNWMRQFDGRPATDPTVLAVRLLAGPADPVRFDDFAQVRSRLDAMHALLQHLREKSAYVVGYELDAASFQWWSSNLNRLLSLAPRPKPVARPAARPAARRQPGAPAQPSWFSRLTFGQLVVGAITLAFVLEYLGGRLKG